MSPAAPAGPPGKITIPLEPFSIAVPQDDVDELRALLKAGRITRDVYENQGAAGDAPRARDYGVRRAWMAEARDVWVGYDWRATESRLNAIPQYTTKLSLPKGGVGKDGANANAGAAVGAGNDKEEYTIHFAALFSTRADAVPVIFSHGWPGLFLEFVPMLEKLRAEHGDDLPIHAIVPSLPGYAFSSRPPLDREFATEDVSALFDQLMRGLGFATYVAQGGDYGAFVTHALARLHPACVAMHLNFMLINGPPAGTPEAEAMAKSGPPPPGEVINSMKGFGYALEHGTKPGTVGAAVGASPLGLLAWLGEKYTTGLEGSHYDKILPFLSLYWFTDCYGSSIWFYKTIFGPKADPNDNAFAGYIDKPSGYSQYPREISRPPRHWVEKMMNLVWYAEPKAGGHFAALERPDEFTHNILEFVALIKGKARL